MAVTVEKIIKLDLSEGHAEVQFFASDSAAGSGGVAIGSIYALTAANAYGLPEGTLKTRMA